MKFCEECGSELGREFDESEFQSNTWRLDYENVTEEWKDRLCGRCLAKAILEDKIDGIYFETCEKCGRRFDFVLESAEYDSHYPWYNGTKLTDEWDKSILCADCAIEQNDAEFDRMKDSGLL